MQHDSNKSNIKLVDIITGLDFQSEETSTYLNKETGEVFFIMSQAFNVVEEEDDSYISMYDLDEKQIETARDILKDEEGIKYIPLPSEFDVHEWEIMKNFCYSVEDDKKSRSLLKAIHGRGAFRCFKDSVSRFVMDDQWYDFRNLEIKKIAIEWCEENSIKYI